MDLSLDDTIAALASAPGPGLRGIVRVSGPEAAAVVGSLFEPRDGRTWAGARVPRRHPGLLRLGRLRVPLPADACLWPTGRSYTGQPMCELHLIGSPPLLEALLEELFAAGARPARAGEFTLRAFLAGRVDLLQAEAVLGVIEAGDEAQLNTALAQLAGGLSRRIAAVHERLLIDLADLEAGLDFVEEDIEFIRRDDLIARLDAGQQVLTDLLEQAESRMHAAVRPRVVLAGLPNAGKSTLFNALAGRDAALVSETAGTTRDYLTAAVAWRGREVEVLDTAGWDEEHGGVMASAQALREEALQRADLVVWCTAANLDPALQGRDEERRAALARRHPHVLHVMTKADLSRSWTSVEPAAAGSGDGAEAAPSRTLRVRVSEAPIAVSGWTGSGLDQLIEAVAERLATGNGGDGELLGSTAARCRDSLSLAAAALARARDLAMADEGDELISVELREALDHLGRIVGRVYTDDILDRIFSRFCIGK